MGEVYRARDTRLGRDVAVKVLPPSRTLDDTARRRFQREAMAASALNHPNIITIYEINSDGDTDFIAMEYVRGSTLSSRIRSSPLGLDEAVGYASQIADALVKAHAAGIVHRDLKPGNVMITDDGLVKVLDFGLAKFDASSANTESSSAQQLDLTLSVPGAITGTIAYMSPEQARGDRVDTRSDVFSFGIVLFEMLSGQLPFAGPNAIAILHNIHFSPPRNLLELRPDTPAGLAALLNRMMEKPPEQRPVVAEVATMLRAGVRATGITAATWQSGGVPAAFAPAAVSAAETPATKQRAKPDFRRKWMVVALVLVAMLGTGGYFLKKKASAKSAASDVAAAEPAEGDAFAWYKRGRQELEHYDRPGAIDRAIHDLEQTVAQDPQSAAGFAALAEGYYLKNMRNADPQWMKLTSQFARKALDLNPDFAASHTSNGLALMQADHRAEAEAEFKNALRLDPKSGVPDRWLGIYYDRVGDRRHGHEALARSLEINPNDWQIYMEFALQQFNSANYVDAAASWEHALKLEPDNLDALGSLGAVYHVIGRDDDAATRLQRALEIQPDSDTYNNLGTIRFYQGQYQEAVVLFEKAVALHANLYDRWGNLGDAYRWAPGHAEKAKEAYKQAIQLVREEISKAPAQTDLRANLAMYLAKSGDTDGALKELGLMEQGKKDPAVLYTMAIAYEVCRQRDKALAALEAAIKAGQSMADLKTEPELASLRADPRYHLRILNANTPKS